RARTNCRQPALQHRHRVAGLLAQRRALAALVRCRAADVSTRSRRTHRRGAALEKLRPLVGAGAVALRSEDFVRRQRLGLRAAAERKILDRSFAAEAAAAA